MKSLLIPVLGRWVQEFKASLSHTEFEINLGYRRFCLKQNKTITLKNLKEGLREDNGSEEDGQTESRGTTALFKLKETRDLVEGRVSLPRVGSLAFSRHPP